jgi:hypothetical protein
MRTRSQTPAIELAKSRIESNIENGWERIKMMKRSATSAPVFDVDIDFDGASRAWQQNKRKLDNRCYEYVGQKHSYNTRQSSM